MVLMRVNSSILNSEAMICLEIVIHKTSRMAVHAMISTGNTTRKLKNYYNLLTNTHRQRDRGMET